MLSSPFLPLCFATFWGKIELSPLEGVPMKDQKLYLYWLYLFILCAALGFIPEPQGLLQALLALTAMLFFVPPVTLLYRGIKQGKRKHLRIIRNLSALSLLVTTVLYVINILCVSAPELVGNILNAALVVFSAPLLTFPIPVAVMFTWACLLVTCLSYWKKTAD